jgi:myo-inositol 2-dehydrogenase/D-chiro-inositol 1-dehydrogenase
VEQRVADAGDTDSVMVVMRTAGGKLAHINNSRRAVYGYDQRVEVLGSKGMLNAANRTPTTVERAGADAVTRDKPMYFFLERYAEAYAAEMAHFIEAINTGEKPSVGARDGRQALVLAEAAVKSLKTGAAVKLA